MKQVLCVLFLAAAAPAFGALELYLPMDARPGRARSLVDRAVRRINGAVRLNDRDKDSVDYVEDVPPALRERNSTSLRLRGKPLAYLRHSTAMTMTDDFSISIWLKPFRNSNGRQTFLLRTGGWSFVYLRSRNEYVFGHREGSAAFALPKQPTGRWQHLALVREAGLCRLWLDGTPLGEPQPLESALSNGGQLYIGAAASNGAHAYNGHLAELGIWSRALSPADVTRLAQGASPLDILDPEKLTRITTTPFPEEIPMPAIPAAVELVRDAQPRTVIAVQKGNLKAELAPLVQERLARAWGITIPIREVADHADGTENLILFGANNSNTLLRELTANSFLPEHTRGSELRVLPQVLDWNRGVIYLGGRSAEQVQQSMDWLVERFPRPTPLPMLARLEHSTHQDRPPQAFLDDMRAIYADHDRNKANRTIPIMASLLEVYRDTGNEDYAAAFGDALSLMFDQYEVIKESNRGNPPTFVFHKVPQLIFLAEISPAFTAKHRRDAAELMRRFMEDTIVFWEMALPARMYAQGQVGYLTNHYNFAARSSYHTSRYLLQRHNYEPARYWQAVANHVFAGVQDNPISPEDAAGYHFLVYRIFTDHALASGTYTIDFFRNDTYQAAVDFAKIITNHHGYVPGYGDANAIGGASHYTLLRDALDILGDPECEYLLTLIARRSGTAFYQDAIAAMGLRQDLPPPENPRYLGLNAVELTDFLLQQHDRYPSFSRPVLNKAVFRSGWDDNAAFLAINGLTSAPHGHDDATGICQFIKGDHLWLFEGHYINRHAEDHNVLTVIRDGVAPDRSRFFPTNRNMAAQILTRIQTSGRDLALLSILLENFNGVDQYRRIAWEKEGGFWVVDTAATTQPGNYLFINQFRTTGEITESPQGILVTQKPGKNAQSPTRFVISEGTGAGKHRFARLETCHGRANTVLPGYLYSDQTTKFLMQHHEQPLEAGDTVRFVNYLTPQDEQAAPITVHELTPDAYLATDGASHRLAVFGRLELPGLLIDADACFIGPTGVLAENARELALAGQQLDIAPDATVALGTTDALDLQHIQNVLAGLADQGTPRPNRPSRTVDAPQAAFDTVLTFPTPVSALAVTDGALAVGLTDGTVTLMDHNGTVFAEQSFGQAISAIAFIEAGADSRWMIGVSGPRTTSSIEVTDAELHALDSRGRRLWQKTLPFYGRRYGDAKTIFRAFINGKAAPPAIIVGCESWTYHAFDLQGKDIWQARCTHGATSGTAGDLDGDGRDEIYAGNEYYTHSIFAPDGSLLRRWSRSPQDVDATLVDLDGDGKLEVISGGFDGFLYVHGLQDNPLVGRKLNVGGQPANISLLPHDTHRLVSASRSGVVTFIGSDLRRTAHAVLPAPALALATKAGRCYTAAMDGFVYELQDGAISGKLPFQYEADAIHPPIARGNDRVLAFSSTNRLYLLR